MIFVTLGSQKFQFDRLLEAVDALIEKGCITEEVFAQIGNSTYAPRHYAYTRFLEREAFAERQEACDILITHGGTGAILGAVKKGKKVIAVPRLAKYGEHIDDHQLQLIGQFREQNLICGLADVSELEAALDYVKGHRFDGYQSNTAAILEDIEAFMEGRAK